jgi:integrase
MATIEWRAGKRGRYAYLQWSDNDGQHRESLGAISEDEAETRRLGKDFELRTGRTIISTAPLVGVVAVMYLEWHKAKFPSSHYRTAQIVNDHILPTFRYVAADQLAVRQVEKWGNDRTQVVAAGSAAKEVRTLKAMLNWAIRNAIIDYAPATKATPPQDVVSRPMHWYSMEELQALYAAASWRAVWQLMVNTGMRRGEASLLRWANVKPDSLLLLSEEEARTKSRKWREIPLTGNAKAALETLKNDTDYVLPVVTKNAITMTFRRDAKRAKVGGSVHSLRHTYGTHLALKGTPVRTLQKLMGHASITTTEKYLHVAERHLKDAMTGFEL